MDNQRLILFVVLSFVLLLLFQEWQDEYGTTSQPQSVSTSTANPAAPASSASSDVPSIAPASIAAKDAAPSVKSYASMKTEQRVYVTTDVLAVEIDTAGGNIRKVDLVKYPVTSDHPDVPFRLMNDELPQLFVAQSGLISASGQAPDHHAIYSVEQTEYQMQDGEESLQVRLKWLDNKGVMVTKVYTFRRNDYLVDVNFEVENNTSDLWQGRVYRQFQRTEYTDSNESSLIYTYTGGVVSSEANKYEKINFDEMSDWKASQSYIAGGWAAMIQHYFLVGWIPAQDELNNYYTKVVDGTRYLLGLSSTEKSVKAGDSTNFNTQIYIGPKEQKRLEEIQEDLVLTVDYGILTIIAAPLYWLMDKIHSFLGNWGFTIILVTMIIKLLFYKLSEKSYTSMANMRRLQPKMAQLKERYADDRQGMSKALMDIYKKEKINPLSGCLPMLAQIPVFIALYWVLLETVELRQAPFILWITDLSIKDPFYVLPILMGLSMFVQQKLNPAPMDPIQQKVLQFLPLIFTLFFAFFPAGLVLYWVVNNIISITQQWYITRKIEAASENKG